MTSPIFTDADRDALWRAAFEGFDEVPDPAVSMPDCWRDADDRTWQRLIEPGAYNRWADAGDWRWVLRSTEPNPEYTEPPEWLIVACCGGKSCTTDVYLVTERQHRQVRGIVAELQVSSVTYAYLRGSNDDHRFGPDTDITQLLAEINDPTTWPHRDGYDFKRGW